VDELARPAKIAQVIAIISDSIGKGENLADGVVIHTVNAIEGIDKHRVAMRL